jgi:peptide/nickel transport system substrate-binding protein
VLQEEPFSVEPCDANTSIIGKVLKQNIVETLVDKNPIDGRLVPRLATSWEQIDPLTWRFHLREGVKFHDGADFDADAVIYALERTLDTRIDCEVRIKAFSEIEITPKAVDSHTLDITTDKPAPILPTMMVPLTIMSPNTPMGEMSRHPVGTGPFGLVNWEAGEEINLKRFDGWWGEQPEVANARYVWRTESTVRAAMVELGEADLAPNIAVYDATSEAMDFSYPNSETTRLRIDVSQPPLGDRRVREALNLAIDRNGLGGSVFSKDVEPATQLVMLSINGHNPDLKVWPYDPDRARQLLAEAKVDGVPVDNVITIIGRTGVYPGSAESLEAIMAMLMGVGFNVELRMLEVAQHVKYLQKPYPPAARADHPAGPARQQQRRRRVHSLLQVSHRRCQLGAQ